jgi:manganese oxidase
MTALLALALAAVIATGDTADAAANDNRRPAGRVERDTLVVRLVARTARWRIHEDTGPAFAVLAFAEEGAAPSVPGPLLRARTGTPMLVSVRNPLAGALVVYGLGARGDGRRDSLVVAPGTTVEARFAAGAPGTYLYWAAFARGPRVFGRRRMAETQLTGALVVDPARGRLDPRERVLVITAIADTLQPDGAYLVDRRGLVLREFVALNGKSWPHTERFTYAVGDSVRWRVLNGSPAPHSMHLHGFYFAVSAKGDDGADADTAYAPSARRMAVTELLMQGQTMRMVWSPDRPGGWIFHCHMTMHAVREPPVARRDSLEYPEGHEAHGDADAHAFTGMSGLVLATTVTGRAPRVAWRPARTLRLFVQSDSTPADSARRFGYVLQQGAAEPARDSIVSPGPVLVLTRGEPTAITIVNRTTEPTAVHWHGIELESYYDGVIGFGGTPGGKTTPAIRPGGSFDVRITPRRAGTFMYHTHFDELRQQYGGLVGTIVVLDPGERWEPETDRVFTITDGVTRRVLINGALAPPQQTLRAGTTYRLRFANIAVDRPTVYLRLSRDTTARVGQPTPYTIETIEWTPLAKDGWTLDVSRRVAGPAVQRVSNGETADFAFTPREPGELVLQAFLRGTGSREMTVIGAMRLRVVAP